LGIDRNRETNNRKKIERVQEKRSRKWKGASVVLTERIKYIYGKLEERRKDKCDLRKKTRYKGKGTRFVLNGMHGKISTNYMAHQGIGGR